MALLAVALLVLAVALAVAFSFAVAFATAAVALGAVGPAALRSALATLLAGPPAVVGVVAVLAAVVAVTSCRHASAVRRATPACSGGCL